MRLRNPKDKDEVINSCTFFYNKEEGFSKEQPIHLEIGMGKGNFILNMALVHPNINFIGVEKYSSVASLAIKKIREYDLPNLKIIITDAKNLPLIIPKKVECIYLNFSDPWPKDRHAKRRLTSPDYLKYYDDLFKNRAQIIMKTDNDNLFRYSLETLQDYGYKLEKISYDLHKEDITNIMTEYEERFTKEGIKIKYVHATKN